MYGRYLTFSMLDYFGSGITSLISSFACGTPILLSKIIKYLLNVWKAYQYELLSMTVHLTPFRPLIFGN